MFNLVDNTYRADLKELNELNFARFDAKLEQRIAQLEATLSAELHKGLREQTRFLYLAWAAQLAATLSLWAR